MASIKLSYSQFATILEEVFHVQIQYVDGIKIETPIKKEIANVEAIRVYLPEFMKEVNQTTERGEYPRLLIKRTVREKTQESEIEIVFKGSVKERHVEDLNYFRKHPLEWVTWGEIVLTIEQAQTLISVLKEMVGIKD